MQGIQVDPYRFEFLFGLFSDFVEQKSGQKFTGFQDNAYLKREEGYKQELHFEGRGKLDVESWKESDIGSGKIVGNVISAIELSGNNTVPWQARFGDEQRPHHGLHLALDDKALLEGVERTLYNLYRQDRDGACFDELVRLLGRKYSLLAYLMFLKDSSRYLPIATTSFDRAFELLGVDIKTTAKCSWENYIGFLDAINQVRLLLEGRLSNSVRLLDAHSFVWMLVAQLSQEVDLERSVSDFGRREKTERESIVRSRIGQGVFRKSLLADWGNACAVTSCANTSLLVASHIKPWARCDNDERLDPSNGLLLSPTLDACFDAGYITFADDRSIIISDALSPEDAASLGVDAGLKLSRITPEHCQYLQHHREHVFKAAGKEGE
ncbi:hypothetical protein FHR95_000907 [Halomonas fontilapidosi]|uniref:HNH nuclease domain-containing protein n=1 Tax=Halomonas fontilapidosi TaxID=616675 RepID=A0A7W5GYQ2_9GAMM|nr:hypothetical protein [Halomonas fontilapidosi]